MSSFAPLIPKPPAPAPKRQPASKDARPSSEGVPSAVRPPRLPFGLSVSRAGDASERQADTMARRALSAPASPVSVPRSDRPVSAPFPALGPGRPLEAADRAFFEPRFNRTLAHVRVHHDPAAAASARALGAFAYTAGSHIAFAPGQYQPGSSAGRELMAHELAHTLQAPAPILHRREDPAGPAPGMTSVDQALAASDWPRAAEIINGYSPDDLRAFLGKHGRGVAASIYVGALANPRVGDQSAVAQATRAPYLDINFDNEVKRKSWKDAAKFLNGFNRDDIVAHLQKLDLATVQAIHDGAVSNPEVGPDSQLAQVSAMLLTRYQNAGKAEGDVLGDQGNERPTGDPLADPSYIEKATKGVGLPILGGPFYLKQTDAPGWSDSVVVPRSDVAFVDPLAKTTIQLTTIYPTREKARAAVEQFGADGAYAFYRGPQGRILPTIISATTAPEITKSAQLAIEGERRYAKAAAGLGVDLLIWYLGARVPAKVGSPPEAVVAAKVVRSTLPAILGEAEYAALKGAAEAAKAATPQLASLTVDEVIAIRAYSAESWSYLNQALRLKDAKELTRLGEFVNLMKSGLRKLPIFKGTVTRTFAMPVTEAAARYQVGATVVEDAFTSTTFGKAVAQREGNVAVTIISSSGRDITAVAVHNESEILFAPGTRFLVTGAKRIGHALLVAMKEIP